MDVEHQFQGSQSHQSLTQLLKDPLHLTSSSPRHIRTTMLRLSRISCRLITNYSSSTYVVVCRRSAFSKAAKAHINISKGRRSDFSIKYTRPKPVRPPKPVHKVYRYSSANTQELPRLDHQSRICILGGDTNVGLLFAHCLAQHPSPPKITLVVDSKECLEQWRAADGVTINCASSVKDSLRQQHLWAEGTEPGFDVEMWSDEPVAGGAEDKPAPELTTGKRRIAKLIVATSADTALPQVERLWKYLGPNTNIMFVHNGVNPMWPRYGKYQSLSQLFGGASIVPRHNWSQCLVSHGLVSNGPFESTLVSPGSAVLGKFLPQPNTSANLLMKKIVGAPGLRSRIVRRVELWLSQFEKLVVDSIIGPLTAVLRCQNGALLEDGVHKDIPKIIDLLLEEASAVLQIVVQHKNSHDVLKPQGSGMGRTKEAEILERLSYSSLKSMFYQELERVRDSTSEMLQDVQAGRTTEVQQLNGWLVKTAAHSKTHGIGTPFHAALTRLVEKNEPIAQEQLYRELQACMDVFDMMAKRRVTEEKADKKDKEEPRFPDKPLSSW